MNPERMRVIGVREARARFSELLRRVEGGEEVTVTRHGRPVARLVSVGRSVNPGERMAMIRRWQHISRNLTLGGQRVRDLISEGRS